MKDTGWLRLRPSYFLYAHSLVGVLEKSYVGQRQPAANSPSLLPQSVTLQMKKKKSLISLDSSLITSIERLQELRGSKTRCLVPLPFLKLI